MLVGLQAKLIILAIAAVVAFGAGWKTRDAFCDAAAAKLQVINLQKQIRARDAALNGDAEIAKDDADFNEKLEGKIRDLQAQIKDDKCFDDAGTDGIRSLWLQRK